MVRLPTLDAASIAMRMGKCRINPVVGQIRISLVSTMVSEKCHERLLSFC
jgi:hypothetical protein